MDELLRFTKHQPNRTQEEAGTRWNATGTVNSQSSVSMVSGSREAIVCYPM